MKCDYYLDVIDINKKDLGKLWKMFKLVILNIKKLKGVGFLDIINGLIFELYEIVKGFVSYFCIVVFKIRENMLFIIYLFRR